MNFNLPHSIESEQHALACMLNSDAEQGVSILTVDHFYLDVHRDIFCTIKHLLDKELEISVVNIYEYLKGLGSQNVTTLSYVMQVANMYSSIVTLSDCVKILNEKLIARSLIQTAKEHIDMALNGDMVEVFDKIRTDYERLEKSALGSCGEEFTYLLNQALSDIEQRQRRRSSGVLCLGVPTGFEKFDEKLGGLSPSNLSIVAGRPGMGKTALILNMIESMAIKNQTPVGFFSLEMSNEEIMHRLVSSYVEIPVTKIRSGDLTDWCLENLKMKLKEIQESPLIIEDSPQNIATLCSKAIQMKNKYAIKALFIDYLQLIEGMRRSDSRYMEVTEISRRLKCLAKQLKIPIVCLSQLSRSVEQRADKTPQLSDLRDSGAIEQDADSVVFLYRAGYYDPYDPTSKIIIAKNRHGACGEIRVIFNEKLCQFKEEI